MPVMTYAQAIGQAIQGEMRRDPDVVVLGLDVKQSIFGTTRGLFQEFGPRRVIDTPVCEGSFTTAGVGAALTGLRPVVEILFSEYVYLAMDALANLAASWRYVSGGGYKIPLVLQTFCGPRGHGAYSHSQSTQACLLNPPGLKVVIPATPAEAKGLMVAAIRDDGPVVFFHHRQLLGQSGEVDEGETVLPLGRAAVVREGADLTMVSCGAMLHRCLEAAERLAGEGLRAEVIDLRTIVPLDEATIAGSLAKTSRLMVVEDGRKRGGIGSEIAAVVAEKYLDLLDAPLLRVAALDTPVPFAAPLEKAHFPQLGTILEAARRLVA